MWMQDVAAFNSAESRFTERSSNSSGTFYTYFPLLLADKIGWDVIAPILPEICIMTRVMVINKRENTSIPLKACNKKKQKQNKQN